MSHFLTNSHYRKKRSEAERIFRNEAKLAEADQLEALKMYDKIAQLNYNFNRGTFQDGPYRRNGRTQPTLHDQKAAEQARLIDELVTRYLSDVYKAQQRFQTKYNFYRHYLNN
jgi:hypothetical protein